VNVDGDKMRRANAREYNARRAWIDREGRSIERAPYRDALLTMVFLLVSLALVVALLWLTESA
jgi:hypothetical protein